MPDSAGMDIQTLIDRGGGVSRFAASLGVSHSTVCDWKRVGALPGARLSQVSRILGLPLEEVASLVRDAASRARSPSADTPASAA